MKEAFAGIDVACAKKKRLPVVVVVRNQDGSLEALPLRQFGVPSPPRSAGNVKALEDGWVAAFAKEVRGYLSIVEKHFDVAVRRVAIDAPSDPCSDGLKRRLAEASLDARGISCFATPTRAEFARAKVRAHAHLHRGGAEARLPHANQLWMLVGFALFRELRASVECIEVYPHAIAAALGAHQSHKSKVEGLLAQLDALNRCTGWQLSLQDLDQLGFGRRHDNLDACLAAWVASLADDMRTPYGVPPTDAIWVPKMSEGA